MVEIVGVGFMKAGKTYYFDPRGEKYELGDMVIVETARGMELGHILIANKEIDESELVAELKPIERKATEEDLDKYTAEYKSNPYNYTSDDESANRQAAKDSAKKIAKLMYKPCIGVKTGYSSTAGDCFAGFAKKGNTEIIAVVLNAPHTKEKFQDAKKLWVYGYDNFKTYTAQEKEDFEFDLDLKRGEWREVAVGIKEDLKVTALKKDKPSQTVTTQIELFDEKPYAPIKKGAVVGKLVAYDNGVKVGSQDMVSLETSGKGGILSYIGVADEDRAEFFVLLALFIALIYVISQRRKKAKARKRRRQRSQVK